MTNLGLSGLIHTVLFGLVSASCTPFAATASHALTPPTRASWHHARQTLSSMQREAQRSRTMKIALGLREPLTHRTLEARGALAVAPPDDLRMILVGPGGTTALDLWLHGDRHRFAVPAIELLKRGDASTPRADKRGLPVDFLRWWILRPMSGTLLWHVAGVAGDRFVLRDGAAIVDLFVARSGRITARRTTWEPSQDKPGGGRKIDEETIDAERLGCGAVRYDQASTNLHVTVTCESEDAARPPNPRAFVDPDAMVEKNEGAGT